MHFLLAGKVLLSLETQTEMSMEYDSTECEFWCQIAKVRSTEQFVGLTCKQRDTHSWENVRGCACTFCKIFRCRACTKHLENFAEYVTTVTTMSSEGAKNACLVVQHGLARSPKGNANRATQRITLLLKPATN